MAGSCRKKLGTDVVGARGQRQSANVECSRLERYWSDVVGSCGKRNVSWLAKSGEKRQGFNGDGQNAKVPSGKRRLSDGKYSKSY